MTNNVCTYFPLSEKSDFEICKTESEKIFHIWIVKPIISIEIEDEEIRVSLSHPKNYCEAMELFLAYVQGYQFAKRIK